MIATKTLEIEYLTKLAEGLPLRMKQNQVIHVDFLPMNDDYAFLFAEADHVFLTLNRDLLEDSTWIQKEILGAIDLNLFEYPSAITRADFYKIQGLLRLDEIMVRLLAIKITYGLGTPEGTILNKLDFLSWKGVRILDCLKKNFEFLKYGMDLDGIKDLARFSRN